MRKMSKQTEEYKDGAMSFDVKCRVYGGFEVKVE